MSAADEHHGSRISAHKHRCPGHAELLLAVDAELGEMDPEAADVALDALAWHLMPADPNPREDLARIAGLVAGADGPLRVSETGTLRLSEALVGVPAHPFVVACALAEGAARAGVHVGLVGGGDVLLVAHRHLREPLVVDPAQPELGVVDAHDCSRGADLRWRCAHQTSCAVLDEIAEDAQRRGDLTRAIRAAELRLDLPFDDAALARRRDDVARVRARLN
jgi:hypothetical protein